MNSNDIVDNLNNIRTVAIQVQSFIHETCSKITESMKLYDLKLKEIGVLDKKIKVEQENLKNKPLQKESKTKRLKRQLKEEKKHVKETVKKVVGQHDELIKVVEVYNKDFAQKHRKNLKDLLTNITLNLKSRMKNPHFHDAYKQFMVIVVKRVQQFTPDQLKNPETSARRLIKDYFEKILHDLEEKDKKKKVEKKYPPISKRVNKNAHAGHH